MQQHSVRAQLLSETGELKERPLRSRYVNAILEVTVVNWKGFLPLRASLLIIAVEALESSLSTARTLIIRRRVAAPLGRINTTLATKPNAALQPAHVSSPSVCFASVPERDADMLCFPYITLDVLLPQRLSSHTDGKKV